MAGSDDMFLDFDIDERDVPRHPPSGANEVHLYQYYVQRLLCTVPRADWLRARTTEGRVPLRANRWVFSGELPLYKLWEGGAARGGETVSVLSFGRCLDAFPRMYRSVLKIVGIFWIFVDYIHRLVFGEQSSHH